MSDVSGTTTTDIDSDAVIDEPTTPAVAAAAAAANAAAAEAAGSVAGGSAGAVPADSVSGTDSESGFDSETGSESETGTESGSGAGSPRHAAPDAAADDAPSANALEAEGDIAADYIEELLDICDLDGDIDIDARGGRAYVSVNSSEDSNLRLLSKPDTVQALQELTRLAVQTKTGGFSRLILDVGGSRQIREAELADLVNSAIDRIEVGGEYSVALAPMSSYERKVVHDIVAERGFSSNSEGEGRDRHTVIKQS